MANTSSTTGCGDCSCKRFVATPYLKSSCWCSHNLSAHKTVDATCSKTAGLPTPLIVPTPSSAVAPQAYVGTTTDVFVKPGVSLIERALEVLLTGDAHEKARLTALYAKEWEENHDEMHILPRDDQGVLKPYEVPLEPARPEGVEVCSMASVKQGSKKALIHSIAHAESYAIDLMWDIVARFGHMGLPRAFFHDWVRIAGEESKHFLSWADRLVELDSYYGALPGHAGLWASAADTKDSLPARLAVVHMVHEARGLDTFPTALKKLQKSNDEVSCAIMRRNVAEEVGHVGAAVRWFTFVCGKEGKSPVQEFQKIVGDNFMGALKPPFNTEMRNEAGMGEEWYLPLARQYEGQRNAAKASKKPANGVKK